MISLPAKRSFILRVIDLNPFQFFIFIVLINYLFEFVIRNFYFTEEVYYNTYADRLSMDMVTQIFLYRKKYEWLTYLLAPLSIYINILFCAICQLCFRILKYDSTPFRVLFNISLKAYLAFSCMQLSRLAWLFSHNNIKTLDDLNYLPLSLLSLLDIKKLPKWSLYALQTLNLWEIFYCVLGGMFLSTVYQIKPARAILEFSLSYLSGLLLWLILATFIVIQIT